VTGGLARRAVAEGIGTFELVFAGCGAIVTDAQRDGPLGVVGVVVVAVPAVPTPPAVALGDRCTQPVTTTCFADDAPAPPAVVLCGACAERLTAARSATAVPTSQICRVMFPP
jgi:glycerol uptake facilitator-like aquaporin